MEPEDALRETGDSDMRMDSDTLTLPSQPFVYALGRIEPRFPSIGIEKEFAQAAGRAITAGLTDQETFQAVLADSSNRYLARQLCWIFVIEGLETYLLAPRESSDLDLLMQSVRGRPQPDDLDLAIGILGPTAPPDACNGLGLPILIYDQIFSFDRDSLLGAIPTPEGASKAEITKFRATAEEVLDRIMQMADNAGATDEHRALNYLAVRYPAVYAQTAAAHADDASLTAVEVKSSRLRNTRTVLDVIFAYTHRQTDVTHKYFVRVDVSEEFPFMVTKLSPYFDR
ncbi:hypothetical protein AB0M20_26890 [Actinoplanes sp. NPDC051633]|uniref:cyanobactin maturation protease PatG family protein n=1 Tax=Actinoplanes sp. NPDC051633 TaxID=3155670 RepID=UPI00341EBF12